MKCHMMVLESMCCITQGSLKQYKGVKNVIDICPRCISTGAEPKGQVFLVAFNADMVMSTGWSLINLTDVLNGWS